GPVERGGAALISGFATCAAVARPHVGVPADGRQHRDPPAFDRRRPPRRGTHPSIIGPAVACWRRRGLGWFLYRRAPPARAAADLSIRSAAILGRHRGRARAAASAGGA